MVNLCHYLKRAKYSKLHPATLLSVPRQKIMQSLFRIYQLSKNIQFMSRLLLFPITEKTKYFRFSICPPDPIWPLAAPEPLDVKYYITMSYYHVLPSRDWFVLGRLISQSQKIRSFRACGNDNQAVSLRDLLLHWKSRNIGLFLNKVVKLLWQVKLRHTHCRHS